MKARVREPGAQRAHQNGGGEEGEGERREEGHPQRRDAVEEAGGGDEGRGHQREVGVAVAVGDAPEGDRSVGAADDAPRGLVDDLGALAAEPVGVVASQQGGGGAVGVVADVEHRRAEVAEVRGVLPGADEVDGADGDPDEEGGGKQVGGASGDRRRPAGQERGGEGEDGGEPEGERAEPQPVEVLTALEEAPERGEGREAQ
ncbi:MAG: hypothetical protein IPN17_37150 [Deltaproteobacteria bacterium]|nr:hypothetical protein [Deltaproteobacteria bacterium]